MPDVSGQVDEERAKAFANIGDAVRRFTWRDDVGDIWVMDVAPE